jgi:hypothetical protein
MAEAANCLLDFEDPAKTGAFQVEQALAAAGLEKPVLSFVVIDAEQAPTVNTNITSKQAPAIIARIQEAVDEVKSVGLRPVIYTYRSFWRTFTGNTTQFSAAGIPLWDTDTPSSQTNVDQLCQTATTAWAGYGGWAVRAGHQYTLETSMLGQRVDLDVFDTSLLFFAQTPGPEFTYVWSASNKRTLTGDGWMTPTGQPPPTTEAFTDDATFGNGLLHIVGGNIEQNDGRLSTLPITVEFSVGVRFPRKSNGFARLLWWGPSVNGLLEFHPGVLYLLGKADPNTGQPQSVVIPYSGDALHTYRMVIDSGKQVTLYADCSSTPLGSVDGTTAPGFDFNYVDVLTSGADVYLEHVAWKEGSMLIP